jgi:glucose-1-phosphate cytidylyltransferase
MQNRMAVHQNHSEPWRVTLVDTGDETATGGRLKRVTGYLNPGPFCLTYGDRVSNVDITGTIAFHREKKALVTLTAVQAPSRYGILDMNERRVDSFREKVPGDAGWINGGFFVIEREAIKLIKDDATRWEAEPLDSLARRGKLQAYKHNGFWYPMDTLRDRAHLEKLWASGRAPWKVWR